ncbi:MAG TPA: hypothetical protein VKA58_02005, partial [Propionibacteriaceae bacterium]|nr:hypothetical protein [Propionibacteriaceae bacterium]
MANEISSSALNDLLHQYVLVEWQASPTATPNRYVLTFAHHVLFDYTVARLLLRNPDRLVESLQNDPDLALTIRPSLGYRFQTAWWSDSARQQFWDLVLQVSRVDSIPEIGKLIGATVAADLADRISDFAPVLRALGDTAPEYKEAAERTVGHVV